MPTPGLRGMSRTMARLAVVTTHPIQYNAPLFAELARRDGVEPRVFYTWSQTREGGQYDPDFGRRVEWDVPLLEGYEHVFVRNTARRPGSDRFFGIVNPGLVAELERWGPDAILVYTWAHFSHLSVMRRFKGRVPILFRGDSTLIDQRAGIRSVLRGLLLRRVYAQVDMALDVGVRNRAYYRAFGFGDDRLCHAPHAVDNDRFSRPGAGAEASARAWRRELGISDEDKVVLFCGKLEAKKDPGCLTRLAAMNPSERLRFLFVGEGHLLDRLREEASGDARVQFLGFQNQGSLPIVYRMADILLLPSLYNETWGLVVNEAMACGRPVIVSDRAGCAPDLVEEGLTGWTYPPGSDGERKLTNILAAVLVGEVDLTEMGARAARKVASYSIEAAADGVVEALQRLVPHHQPQC